MDQVILDMLSVIIGGSGLFVVVTKYNVPEVRENFYGKSNPFEEKANIIDDVMTWIFISLSALGLFALIIKDIYGDLIPERLYSHKTYWLVFGIGLLFAYAVVKILDLLGKKIARRKWFPVVRDGYREAFELTQNDLISKNPDKAQRIIELIEKAFDVNTKRKDLSTRLEDLKKFFE
jgi:hypothetical protein